MPGKHWSRQERRILREQISAGVAPHDILNENRSCAGICYMLRVLRIHWSNRWTRAQTGSLIAQIKQGNKLPELRIANKSPAAINAKRGHLRMAGKLRHQPGRVKQKYSKAEVEILEHYGWQLGWSARQIHTAGVLPNAVITPLVRKWDGSDTVTRSRYNAPSRPDDSPTRNATLQPLAVCDLLPR